MADPRLAAVAALDADILRLEKERKPLTAPLTLTIAGGVAFLVGFVPPLFVGMLGGLSHSDTDNGRPPLARPGYRKHVILGAAGLVTCLTGVFWLRRRVHERSDLRQRVYQLREERRQLLDRLRVSLGASSMSLELAF